jgi:hypothetical protein
MLACHMLACHMLACQMLACQTLACHMLQREMSDNVQFATEALVAIGWPAARNKTCQHMLRHSVTDRSIGDHVSADAPIPAKHRDIAACMAALADQTSLMQ